MNNEQTAGRSPVDTTSVERPEMKSYGPNRVTILTMKRAPIEGRSMRSQARGRIVNIMSHLPNHRKRNFLPFRP